MRGFRNDVPSYGSVDTNKEDFTCEPFENSSQQSAGTSLPSSDQSNDVKIIISIDEENNERTPLLKQLHTKSQLRTQLNSFDNNDAASYSDASTRGLPSSSSFNSDRSILAPESYYSEASGSSYVTSSFSYNSTESRQQPKLEVCDFRLILFISFLIAGLVLASYLMLTETRLPTLGFSLDLVGHDIWSRMSLEGLLNHSNVRNVLIMQTRGDDCSDSETCIEVLKNMQNKKGDDEKNSITEIPYNFLIGSDGQTYEVRGWDYESGFKSLPQNNTLVIGFIGDYNRKALSKAQLASAHSLIRESVKRNKLQQDYDIYSLHNMTVSSADGQELSQVISKWPRFKNQIHVT